MSDFRRIPMEYAIYHRMDAERARNKYQEGEIYRVLAVICLCLIFFMLIMALLMLYLWETGILKNWIQDPEDESAVMASSC